MHRQVTTNGALTLLDREVTLVPRDVLCGADPRSRQE